MTRHLAAGPLKRSVAGGVLAVASAAAHAQATDFGGHLRLRRDAQTVSSATTAEAELRGRWQAVTAAATLAAAKRDGDAVHSHATVNELYGSDEVGGWSFSAGRKIVAWDVGYGFRPNDLVQQERRRTLLPALEQGKSVVQAEWFGAEDAVSLVAVDPVSSTREHALAMRAYRRVGSADWHGFARWGESSGGSVGSAVSWVASDTVELHGSVRWIADGRPQALAGIGWTGERKLSLMAEAWYDGAAPSDDAWASPARGTLFARAAGLQNLRRRSLYARLAWDHDGWTPAVDLLWLPADRSRSVTASLAWQGDRVRVDAGWRRAGGPAGSVLDANPNHRMAFAAATWSF